MKIIISFFVIAVLGVSASIFIKNQIEKQTRQINDEMNFEEQSGKQNTTARQKTQPNTKTTTIPLDSITQNEQTQEQQDVQQQENNNTNQSQANSIINSNTQQNETSASNNANQQNANQNNNEYKNNNINIENVRGVLNMARQYDIIKIIRSTKQGNDPAKRVIISDYFIILSPDNIIRSNNYQTIVVAPVMSETNYQQSTQKNQFIKITLQNNEIAYTIPSSLRAIPKLAISKYYSSPIDSNIPILKKATSKILQ